MTALSVDELVDGAIAATGLDDFGDTPWRDGLEVIVASANAEADLNEVGRQVLAGWAHERLANRLRVFDWVRGHPEVVHERVAGPLVIAGMLRTGTTILLELLAQDPANRPLMKWEALDCLPPPERETFDTDPRIARWVEIMETTYEAVPELKAVHWEPGDGPTECVALLGQSFRSQDWYGLFHLPTYVDWIHHCDMGPAYEYHRLCLQLLQSRAPGRWLLKAPGHLYALDALFAVYPDAQVVVTHRDPAVTVPSSASLSHTTGPGTLTVGAGPTAGYWGQMWLENNALKVDRLLEYRDVHGDDRFYDLDYADLMADVPAAVEGIYGHFGVSLTTEARDAMAAYLAGHPQARHGAHRYALEDFGLSPADIEARFGPYRARFGRLN